MPITTVRLLLAAIATVAAAGCGSADAPAPDAGGDRQALGPAQFEGVIEKKIGEPAGLNCPDDPNKPCDLNFTVTAIQQDAQCDASADRPGPDQQFLRFDIDAFSSRETFEFPDSADALRLAKWGVDRAKNEWVDNLTHYAECSTGEAPVTQPVAPGTHAHATVVVRAPKPAQALRFSFLDVFWEWKVPGAD